MIAPVCLIALDAVAGAAPASDAETRPAWAPSGVFVQAGTAGHTRALVIGAAWEWAWSAALGRAWAGGHWEASVGHWRSRIDDAGRSTAKTTRIGVAPVLQIRPWGEGSAWFAELGLGVNALFPIYRSGDKRFSTVFNFSEHLAFGRRFGARDRHELALRVQHYSNGGLKAPNPGENFLELRYTARY